MATLTANTRDITNAIKGLTLELHKQTRVLEAVNQNVMELVKLLKEK